MYDTHYKYDNLISSKKLTLKFYTKEKECVMQVIPHVSVGAE